MQRARYAFPVPHLIIPLARLILGIRSPLSRDAATLLRGARPRPTILNAHSIPPMGPFILVLNHYDRPGMGTWWAVCGILVAIAETRREEPREVRVVMSREWWYPAGLGRMVKQPLTRWAFGKLGQAYEMILVPPVLGNNELRGEGAMEIRRALALTRGASVPLIGIAPEGRTGEHGALCQPPHGTGLFLSMLSHSRIPFVPAGIYETEDRTLTVDVGAPFHISVARSALRDEQDRDAARQVMVEIGKRLPRRMWGVYWAEVEGALDRVPT